MLKKYQPLFLVLIAYIIIGVFYPTITANFVNLDDNVMVLGNDYIKSFSFGNLKETFTTPYYKLYHPLVTLSYAFEYLFCKLDPFLYHFDNLLLHILNTLLVFFIIKRFSKSFFISYFTALIFAVHPIHVEAVSWISARKDTLYSFFFLLSILTYMKIDDDSSKYKKLFTISIISFFLSCLSKPTAVTLPLFLILIDFCQNKISLKTLKRYLPYIAISAIFTYIAITFHYSAEEKIIYTLFVKYVNFISAHLNVLFYGYKFILPINLSCLYPYFFDTHTMMPWYVLYSPFVLYVVILFVLLSLEHTKKIFFGFFFFFFALLPSSGIMPTGVAPVADRYAYLAIIGLAYLLAELLSYLYKKSLYFKVSVICFSVCILGAWSYLTYSRNITWRDSMNLMTEAVNYAPESAAHAYLTRGIISKGKNNLVDAEADFDKSFSIAKDNITIYFHRAHLKQLQKKYDEALKIYSKIPESYYDYDIVINNIGLILGEQDKTEQAIKYLKKQIAKRGEDSPFVEYLYSNLSMLYFKEKNYDEALNYVNLACEKDPSNYVYYVQKMIIYNEKNDFEKFEKTAFEGLEKTKNNENIINELANKYFMMGRYDDVEKLYLKEQKLDSDNHRGMFLLGSIAAIKKNFKVALIYYTMAIETSKDKENAEYYFKRAAVYLILGDYEKAKYNMEVAEKKGAVIDDEFKEGINLLKQQIVEQERRIEEEKKYSDKFASIQEYRQNAKKTQEEIISSDISAVKNREQSKLEQEKQISENMKAAKEKEAAGKQVQEGYIQDKIQGIKELEQEKENKAKLAVEEQTSGELAAIKNIEKRRKLVEEETSKIIEAIKNTEERKKIEEQNMADRLKEIKGKDEQESQIAGEIKTTKMKEIEENKTAKELQSIKNIEISKKEQEGLLVERMKNNKQSDRMQAEIKTSRMKNIEEQKTSKELNAIKAMEAGKLEQENKISALLSISKWKEAIRKQIAEESLAYRLQELRNIKNRTAFIEQEAKKTQEDKILACINIFKFREATRKQIQEEAIALSLKMKKELSRKELAAKKEHESKIFAMLSIFKAKEFLRKQIEEQNTYERLQIIKNLKPGERIIQAESMVTTDKSKKEIIVTEDIDVYELLDGYSYDDDTFDEDSAFNI